MASSSSSFHTAPAPVSSSRSCKYDVFLSFRGEDTRKTFVDHLYSTLKDRLICVYKDDQTLPRGESIKQSLFEAIEESRMAVIIFSKNYADSSWCLDELTHIMKCKDERELTVIPIFYDVEPTEVRNQKRKFGDAFAKQVEKNVTKAEVWRKALVDVSNIAGWEPKNIANGHESQFIKTITDTILDRLFPLNSCIDEDLVGMRARFQDMKSLLDVGLAGVRMVGIWGVGGGGKTTLASYVYKNISDHFQGHCLIENVKDETSKSGLKKMQKKILSALFKQEVKVHSVVEGKDKMKSMLGTRSVLVVLDDVDKLDQLEALAGKHSWFGSGSRIIITTRNEHLLRIHKVDHVYPVKLLSRDEAICLFKRHAYNEEEPIEDYRTLSSSVVSYCAGLPLAIKVLGSFLYDKSNAEWESAMKQLKDNPDAEVVEKLKISFDGLKATEKELFLDIACFFRRTSMDYAAEVLEACGHHLKIGIKVLIQNALIMIVDGRFDIHDLVQEMGHYIVRGSHPNNPEKHSRLWKNNEIMELPLSDEAMEYDKIESIKFLFHFDGLSWSMKGDSSRFCKILSKMKNLRMLDVDMHCESSENAEGAYFLSNELRYINWWSYPSCPFPHSFQPTKLVILNMTCSMQKELWKGYKLLPSLRVLQLKYMKNLLSTPDFDGLPRLQKLSLKSCRELEDIHPSLGSNTSLEYFYVSRCRKLKRILITSQMKNIKTLIIRRCYLQDGVLPCGIGVLSNLQELNLTRNSFSRLDFSLSQLTRLKFLDISYCDELLELPELPSSLAILAAHGCKSLTIVEDVNKDCKELCQVSLDNYRWSERLLQSMLKGKAIANGIVHLNLKGIEIPKGLKPPLVRGSSCRLELPENWSNDFSGFLIFVVMSPYYDYPVCVSMKQVSGMYFEDDVVWEESDGDCDKYNKNTLVWYVLFGSLRDTIWWNQTYKSLFFNVEQSSYYKCDIFGVRLVKEKSTSGGLTKTSTSSSSPYTPTIKMKIDSASALMVDLIPYTKLNI